MRSWNCLLIVGLLAAVVGTFGHVVSFDFVMFDDDTNIVFNPHLGTLDLDAMHWAFSDTSYMRRYLPLGWLAFFGLFTAGGLDPAWYHAASLVVHALNTVLVFAAARQFARGWFALRVAEREARSAREISSVAAIVAALWGCHPLRAESVGWASGLLYLLSATGALVSWLAFCRAEMDGDRRWHLFAVVAQIASALVYPITLGLPVLMFAWLWARTAVGGQPFRWKIVAPYAIVSALTLAMALLARFGEDAPAAVTSLSTALLFERVGQAAYVWIYYLWRPFWPAGLGPVYETLLPGGLSLVAIAVSGVGWVLLTIFAIAWRRHCPWLLPAWVGYMGCMLPHTGLLERPFFTADRYSYFIGIWQVMVLGVALRAAMKRWGAPQLVLACVAAAIALGVAAHRQAGIWQNTSALFARIDDLIRVPFVRASYQMRYAAVLIAAGDAHGGEAAAQKAHEIDPNVRAYLPPATVRQIELARQKSSAPLQAVNHHSIALAHLREGDSVGAGAHFGRALAIAPEYTGARFNRALARAHAGESRGALADFFVLDAKKVPALQRSFFWRLLAAGFRASGDEPLATAAAGRARQFEATQ